MDKRWKNLGIIIVIIIILLLAFFLLNTLGIEEPIVIDDDSVTPVDDKVELSMADAWIKEDFIVDYLHNDLEGLNNLSEERINNIKENLIVFEDDSVGEEKLLSSIYINLIDVSILTKKIEEKNDFISSSEKELCDLKEDYFLINEYFNLMSDYFESILEKEMDLFEEYSSFANNIGFYGMSNEAIGFIELAEYFDSLVFFLEEECE